MTQNEPQFLLEDSELNSPTQAPVFFAFLIDLQKDVPFCDRNDLRLD